jgi:L-threonylcarbamoyladenylate synthase
MVIKNNSSSLISSICRILTNKGVIIIKCDTIYGIVGIAPDTEEKIKNIKKREKDKQFLMLIAEHSWIRRFSDQVIPQSISCFWPGPLTLILKRKKTGTIALRFPDDPFLVSIMKNIGKPLFSTSVNYSDEAPLDQIEKIIELFEKSVDLIVDSGDSAGSLPSTIVDLTEKPYKILRQGVLRIPKDALI